MPRGNHDIKFFPGAVASIDRFRHAEVRRENDGRYDPPLDCAISIAESVVLAARKKTFGIAVVARRGKLRAARDRWRQETELCDFFGLPNRMTKRDFNRMARFFEKMDDRLSDGLRVRVRPFETGRHGRCRGTSHRSAYVSRIGGRLGINICPKWFTIDIGDDGPERQAAILVHELIHKLGLFGRGHPEQLEGRNPELIRAAKELARRDPDKAARNPDNFEAYVVAVAERRGLAAGCA